MDKVPLCVADCVRAHELAHVKYRQAECTKLAAAWKKVKDAIAEADAAEAAAKQNKTDADFKKWEAATEKLAKAQAEFDKAITDHEQWFKQHCRENEGQAYQAGIDACQGAKVEKECTELGEAARYKQLMKEWEQFKKNPPNCG
jgi:hypothetical protein